MGEISLEECFRVLELPSSASEAEAWTAFLRLARRNHPDLHRSGKQDERFIEIVQAYRIVQQELRRRAERTGVTPVAKPAPTKLKTKRDWGRTGERVLAWLARGLLLGGALFLLFVVGMVLYQCAALSFPRESIPRPEPYLP